MKKLLSITNFIIRHPLASKDKLSSFGRFFRWQIGQKLIGYPVLYPLVEQSMMLVEKGMAGATGNIYTGLLEFNEMAFVLHVLRPGDLFGDIGANVGVYTILASKNAGSQVIAAEPIAGTFEKLKRNVLLNEVSEQVRLIHGGIGAKSGELSFTNNLDTVNHVLSSSELDSVSGEVTKVPVFTLDMLCAQQHPILLKIDVEGFEWEVLLGASSILTSTILKAIIIELNGSGGRYGYEDGKIHAFLLQHGFTPYSYEPFERKLSRLESYGNHNTIYMRDLPWIENRIKAARRFKILNNQL